MTGERDRPDEDASAGPETSQPGADERADETDAGVPRAAVVVTDVAEAGVGHPVLRRLYAYWQGKRGERLMPARSDLDPLEIPSLLRHLILLDVTHDPLRFRVRLYGTEVADLRGRDLTGRYLYEGAATSIGETTRPWNLATVETRRPHYVTGPYEDISDGRIGTFYRLGLPLSEAGERVDMLMIALVREWETD